MSCVRTQCLMNLVSYRVLQVKLMLETETLTERHGIHFKITITHHNHYERTNASVQRKSSSHCKLLICAFCMLLVWRKQNHILFLRLKLQPKISFSQRLSPFCPLFLALKVCFFLPTVIAIAAGVCDVVFAEMKELAVWIFTFVVKGTNLSSINHRYHQGLVLHARKHKK